MVTGAHLFRSKRLVEEAVRQLCIQKQHCSQAATGTGGAVWPRAQTADWLLSPIARTAARQLCGARQVCSSAQQQHSSPGATAAASSTAGATREPDYTSAHTEQQEGQSAAGTAGTQEETGSGNKGSGSEGSATNEPTFSDRVRSWAAVVQREVAAAVVPNTEVISPTRQRDQPAAQPAEGAVGGGALMTVAPPPESAWFRALREKLGGHPFFARLRSLADHRVVAKGRDVAEDLRQRWETSDSALVHRLQDMTDSLLSETEVATAVRVIRERDPPFDMLAFLRAVKADVPEVVKAYLEGKIDLLRLHCSPEMTERLAGLIRAQEAQGHVSDSTILDVSDVELFDLKMLEDNPVIIVQFNCQQINCTRDKFGNVVEGQPDAVQRVYYYWALQQDSSGFLGADGKHYPPRWQLREMMIRGMHNLL